MRLLATKTRSLENIRFLRALFLQETNFQIRYDACHGRGWADSYLLTIDDVPIGYGSIKGQERSGRDTIFEFFVIRSFRKLSSRAFHELLGASAARFIECQSNDLLLSAMLYEFSDNVRANVVLFQDHAVTEYVIPGAVVRPRLDHEQVFEHEGEPAGDYVMEVAAEVVATGGFMLHYNPPFADLYMEVRRDCRRRGYGSFLLQELKKECYLAGRVPAARTDLRNTASRAALNKAGLRECGFMLTGTVTTVGRQLS
jgi:GNAT superfamily N-acetyltransferase